MVLVLKGGRAEINEANIWLQQNLSSRNLATGRCRDGWNFAVICKGLVCGVMEQNILRLQVGVYKFEIMQNCRSVSGSCPVQRMDPLLTGNAGE